MFKPTTMPWTARRLHMGIVETVDRLISRCCLRTLRLAESEEFQTELDRQLRVGNEGWMTPLDQLAVGSARMPLNVSQVELIVVDVDP